MTYSECVFVALVIQLTMRMRRIILPSVACPTVKIFPYYLINDTIFGKKPVEHKKRVLIFSTSFV